MPADPWQHRLERLRQHRVRPAPPTGLAPVLEEMARRFRDEAKRVGGAGGVWAAHCPPELLARTSVQGVVRGVLTIGVENASARYALDRWLRAGGEQAVIAASSSPIRKVKLVVA